MAGSAIGGGIIHDPAVPTVPGLSPGSPVGKRKLRGAERGRFKRTEVMWNVGAAGFRGKSRLPPIFRRSMRLKIGDQVRLLGGGEAVAPVEVAGSGQCGESLDRTRSVHTKQLLQAGDGSIVKEAATGP